MVREAHKYGCTCDAGGISRGSSGKTSAIAFSAVQPRRLNLLKATSNAFLAEELALGDLGPTGMVQAFKTASTHIPVRTAGPLVGARGRELLPPLPPD